MSRVQVSFLASLKALKSLFLRVQRFLLWRGFMGDRAGANPFDYTL
ncbi:hypothetical protein [Laspinema olomoucense]|nr:hypothetical protein [Laspinema sp. D3a]MCT7987640.1 hypothetical protein [Laspinema sp. D3a]